MKSIFPIYKIWVGLKRVRLSIGKQTQRIHIVGLHLHEILEEGGLQWHKQISGCQEFCVKEEIVYKVSHVDFLDDGDVLFRDCRGCYTTAYVSKSHWVK